MDDFMDYMLLLDDDEEDEPKPEDKSGCGCLSVLFIGVLIVILWLIFGNS